MRWRGSAPARICCRRASCSTGGSTRVSQRGREAVIERLKDWLRGQVERDACAAARRGPVPPRIRRRRRRCARCSPCWSTKAASSRASRWPAPLAALDREQRRAVTRLRRPHRRARPVHAGGAEARGDALAQPPFAPPRPAQPMAGLPPPSSVVLPTPAEPARLLARLGFRAAGPQMIRVDMAERLARHAHEAQGRQGRRAGRRGPGHLARPAAAGGGEADARHRLPPGGRRSRLDLARPRAPAAATPGSRLDPPSPRWRG